MHKGFHSAVAVAFATGALFLVSCREDRDFVKITDTYFKFPVK